MAVAGRAHHAGGRPAGRRPRPRRRLDRRRAAHRDGACTAVHVAGAGELVTKLIDSELALDDRETAESVKRHPLAQGGELLPPPPRGRHGPVLAEPLPPQVFARVVVLDPGRPGAGAHAATGWTTIRRVRREAKRRVFVVNALRALRAGRPARRPAGAGLRGAARRLGAGLRDPGHDRRRRSPRYGVVCGTGNVHGTEGPRNAVASGLVMAYAQAAAQ